MTDRDATNLKIQLDAMRLARAEDQKLCARLEARVKELEAEVSLVRGYLQEYHDTGRISWNERRIAEGTRDEPTTQRCSGCGVPVSGPVPEPATCVVCWTNAGARREAK